MIISILNSNMETFLHVVHQNVIAEKIESDIAGLEEGQIIVRCFKVPIETRAYPLYITEQALDMIKGIGELK